MSRSVLLIGKAATAALWLVVGLALFGAIPAPLSTVVCGFGALVLAVHVLEVVYLMAVHRQRVRSGLIDTLDILVFGVFSLTAIIGREDEG